MDLYDFWAKLEPRQSVVTHGLVSGRIAQFIWDHYISAGTKVLLQTELQLAPDKIRAFLGYLVSLHDIGKIEYCFQSKDPETKQFIVEGRIVDFFKCGKCEAREDRATNTVLFAMEPDERR